MNLKALGLLFFFGLPLNWAAAQDGMELLERRAASATGKDFRCIGLSIEECHQGISDLLEAYEGFSGGLFRVIHISGHTNLERDRGVIVLDFERGPSQMLEDLNRYDVLDPVGTKREMAERASSLIGKPVRCIGLSIEECRQGISNFLEAHEGFSGGLFRVIHISGHTNLERDRGVIVLDFESGPSQIEELLRTYRPR